VHDWLHDSNNGKWVLILDNVDDARFLLDTHLDIQGQSGDPNRRASQPLRESLPKSQNGSILITSRSREAALKLVEHSDIIAVEPMDEAHALALFEKKLGKHGESQDVAELAAALEFMPLAIVQAATYISQRAPRRSVRQYLEEFRKSDRKKASLLNHEGGQLRRDWQAKNSIIITWQISFDYILQTRPSAADLLSLMSFFDRQGIPEALLRNRTKEGNARQDQTGCSRDNDEDDDEDSESQSSVSDEFEDDVLALRNYSFISVSADTTTFEMHRLVQLSMRKWLEANKQLNKWTKESIRVLIAVFPSGDYETWVDCQVLFPHAREVISHVTGNAEDMLNQAKIAFSTGWYLYLRGEYKTAEKVVRMSVKTREKVLGPEHPDTLATVNHLGSVLERQGKYEEAEAMHQRALKAREKVLGPEHPDTLASVNYLGFVLERQGKYKEAEVMNRRALKAREKVLGPEHPSTLVSVNDLGFVLERQGKYEEAEAMHRRALKAKEKVLRPEHPSTLTSVNDLGFVLERQGKYKEAEAMHRRALKEYEKNLGPEHPATPISVNNLGFVLERQGKYKEAEAMHRRALKAREKVLGPKHPDTLASVNNLGSVLSSQGKYEEAEAMHQRALKEREKLQGPEHPYTLTSVNDLGSVLSSQGKYEEAEAMHRRALKAREKVLGPEHPDTLTSMANLAPTYRDQGQWKEAEELEVQVMETRKRVLGAEHPSTLTSMNNLAFTWKEQDRVAEAIELMERCAQLRTKVLGAEHPHTLSSAAALMEWEIERLKVVDASPDNVLGNDVAIR
jgi:tetratricopeptide (TPR) repeat protein